MADRPNREIVEQYVAAMTRNDIDALESLVSVDVTEDYPQSGERIKGRANLRAIFDNYPGRRESDFQIGKQEVIGSGDEFVTTGSLTYPNGETWHMVRLLTVRNGKIARITSYFAQPFEAPAWRAQWVERAAEPAGVKR